MSELKLCSRCMKEDALCSKEQCNITFMFNMIMYHNTRGREDVAKALTLYLWEGRQKYIDIVINKYFPHLIGLWNAIQLLK